MFIYDSEFNNKYEKRDKNLVSVNIIDAFLNLSFYKILKFVLYKLYKFY